MKKLFRAFLAFSLLWTCSVSLGETVSEPTVCATVAEFVTALGSDRDIVLKSGTYDLTPWITENLTGSGAHVLIDYSGVLPRGVYADEEYDGYELVLNGLENLSIRTEEDAPRAEIVCEPRYADVLRFENCKNISLSDLVLGHTPEQGSCTGNVLEFRNSENILVSNCDLYGCGAYALGLDETIGLTVRDSLVHDCSYGAVDSNRSAMVFENTEFTRCRQFAIFDLRGSKADFNQCKITNMSGTLFYADEVTLVTLTDCTLDEGCLRSLHEDPGYGKNILVK
ncbi:MAG: right-handed parallel beta-helix repeat-containing protein [Clostridia bacterium]|nr:right-handed parallel beta-helix repeat-containing protein [Clostridia bacterium]